MADDGDARAVRLVLGLSEIATQRRRQAQDGEEVGADAGGRKALRGLAFTGSGYAGAGADGDVLKNMAAMLAPLLHGFIGKVQGAAARAAFIECFVKTDQTIGLGKGERAEQRALNNGEDGRVRTDAEGERRDRDDAEGRRFPEKAERVADVVH
jgi:hypothetical protein